MSRGIPADQLTQNNTLVAIYDSYDRERDRPLYAVGPEAFQAIMEGFACGNCLKWFGGVFCSVCPDCGQDTGPSQAVPAWWTNYPDLV